MDKLEELKDSLIKASDETKRLKEDLASEMEKARDLVTDNFRKLFWPEFKRLSDMVRDVSKASGFVPADYYGRSKRRGLDNGESLDLIAPNGDEYLYAGASVFTNSEGINVMFHFRGTSVDMGESDETLVYGCEDIDLAVQRFRRKDKNFSSLALGQAVGTPDRVLELLDFIREYVADMLEAWGKVIDEGNKSLAESVQAYKRWIEQLGGVKEMEDGSVEVTLGGRKYHATLMEE